MGDVTAVDGGSRPADRFRPRVVDETDGYTSAVAGVTVEAIRIGEGERPNVVTGVPGEKLTVTSSAIGFPMNTHAHVPEDRIVFAHMVDVSGDSRWCGQCLEAGMGIVYGSGVEHTALNRPGLEFHFGVTRVETLDETAAQLGVPVRMPRSGEMLVLSASPKMAETGAALAAHVEGARRGAERSATGDAVLRALTRLLADDDLTGARTAGRGFDSRDIVHRCLDLAESVDRIPSLVELCAVAAVSERRLRSAFTEEFGLPPSRFFRMWALDQAHRRLRDSTAGAETVTQVATTLGMDHLGRFAGQYLSIYGEHPSVTLRGLVGAAGT